MLNRAQGYHDEARTILSTAPMKLFDYMNDPDVQKKVGEIQAESQRLSALRGELGQARSEYRRKAEEANRILTDVRKKLAGMRQELTSWKADLAECKALAPPVGETVRATGVESAASQSIRNDIRKEKKRASNMPSTKNGFSVVSTRR